MILPIDQVMEREMLDTAGAARYLGVAEQTVRKWARLGKIPCYKYSPRAVRFSMTDLEEFKRRSRR